MQKTKVALSFLLVVILGCYTVFGTTDLSTRETVLLDYKDSCKILWPWLVVEHIQIKNTVQDMHCMHLLLHGSGSFIARATFETLFTKDVLSSEWLPSGFLWTFRLEQTADWLILKNTQAIFDTSTKEQCPQLFHHPPILRQSTTDISRDQTIQDIGVVCGFRSATIWNEDSRLADLAVMLASMAHHKSDQCSIRLHFIATSAHDLELINQLLKSPQLSSTYQDVVTYLISDEETKSFVSDSISNHLPSRYSETIKKLLFPWVLDGSVHDIMLVDTDLIVLDDVCSMGKQQREAQVLFGLSIDQAGYYGGFKEDVLTMGALDPDLPFCRGLNSGVMFWNMDQIRLLMDFETTWKQNVAQYLYDNMQRFPQATVDATLQLLLELPEQSVLNHLFRKHPSWLTVMPLGFNLQLIYLRDESRNPFCRVSNLNIQILHANGAIFRDKKHALFRQLVWKSFLTKQFSHQDPVVFQDLSMVNFKQLARYLLYRSCLL